jgi:hypothetical protein
MKLNPHPSELRWAACAGHRLVAVYTPGDGSQPYGCLIPRDATIRPSFHPTWVRNYLWTLDWQPWDNTNHSFLEQKDRV